MHTIRVDGNDVLAVYNATKEARRLCVEEGRGVLLEAMTYRFVSHPLAMRAANFRPFITSVGHHSTSDDSFAYRPRQEVEDRKRLDNPIARFRLFLEARGWWSASEEDALKARVKEAVLQAFRRAEALPKPELGAMFEQVYGGDEPWTIVSSYFWIFRS